jgi:general secretion pathway protein G
MNKLQSGFSLLELMITVVILAILITFAIPYFGGADIDCKDKNPTRLPTVGNPCPSCSYIVRAKIVNAMGKLGIVALAVDRFELSHNRYPTSMDELNLSVSDSNDPWGNPYVFLNHADVNGNGPLRKDHNMVPVNDYFDIYSMGPDGKTATPFTSIPGGDDIVIANNGLYVGVACFYYSK